MPKTATPRKPETVSSKLAETRAKSKNRSLPSLLGIGDNEKRLATDLGSGLNDVIGRGTIAGLLGLPGDLAGAGENTLRSLLGLPQVVPYGGSEHIGQKMEQAGLVSDVRRPKTELLASLISPAQAATAGYKAPQMARAGVKALDNLSAPRTMGRQQGAIENLWHGSPHTFDRFDLSKIGTGEGAQAYGHGAYLAESPDVAQSYMARTGEAGIAPGDSPEDIARKAFAVSGGNRNYASSVLDGKTFMPVDGIDRRSLDAAKKIIDDGNISGANIYQTRLAWPDAREATDPLSPDHFLHWDKPLSEQSPMVRNVFGVPDDKAARYNEIKDRLSVLQHGGLDTPEWNALVDEASQLRRDYGIGQTGEEAYRGLGDIVSATNTLGAKGIPGIRYLDGGSRGAGAGSHNYVVFDDKLIDIVSRNGQPVGNLGKMVAPQDEALRVAQGGDLQAPLSVADNAPMSKPLFVTIGGSRYPVTDMLDAARKYDMYREQADAGASMLPPVDIVDDAGNVVANFSYNGRLWKGARGASDRVEIDPANWTE